MKCLLSSDRENRINLGRYFGFQVAVRTHVTYNGWNHCCPTNGNFYPFCHRMRIFFLLQIFNTLHRLSILTSDNDYKNRNIF